jgi:eukaryotic-like serine/threonine-protein kinase
MSDATPTPIPPVFPALADRYRVDRELGRGGMATVYLAQDIRHDRKVALKVLHPDLAAALGAQRFLSEIRTTANLQHPHIVPLHDSGEAEGLLYYVMPFVEGESLRDRLDRERLLPIDDAIRIAGEVADALAYAHSHGVIHRDIKPENILLHGGHAMVADFGIALAVQAAGTARLTQTGLSLGTPQYMSPEQAMGEAKIDARSDVYALGAVTYEMLVGEPPFTGPSLQAIIARVVSEDPRPLITQRKSIPPQVEGAVLKALEKIPADRFASPLEFSAALHGTTSVAYSRRGAKSKWREISIALGALAALLVATLVWSLLRAGPARNSAPPLTARIFADALAPSTLSEVALSPDGTQLAYVTTGAFDGGRLWLRAMSDGSVHPIPETEGARYPFWSPDGKSIGFFSNFSLRVVSLTSGAVRTLAPTPNLAPGASWGAYGDIVYSPYFLGLYTISSSGGEPRRFSEKSYDDREPSFLPDGRHFLYWRAADGRAATLFVGDLKTGKSEKIAENISSPKYIAPGFVAYFVSNSQSELEQPGQMFVQRFDAERFALTGDPMTLSQRVERPFQYAPFSATSDLLLMREAHTNAKSHGQESVYWLDRSTGKMTSVNGNGPTWTFRISHDGRYVAFGGLGLWLYDPARDVAVRLPTQAAAPWPPVWSPDDRNIAVVNARRLSIVAADGQRAERFFDASPDEGWPEPMDWSTDGAIYFLREASQQRTVRELWRYVLKDSRSEQVTTGPGNIYDARVSPDAKWIAWESDATGRREIYLGPRAGTATPLRVSKAGGGSPRWRGDGRELLYMSADGHIVSASVALGDHPVIGDEKPVAPKLIHPEPFGTDPYLNTRIDVAPGGNRLLVQLPPDPGVYWLTLVQGWQSRIH